jgi:uncharacterized protein (DUF305 family)
MNNIRRLSRRAALGCSLVALTIGAAAYAQPPVPIVQPGAPGQPPRVLTAQEASQVADTRFTADDVKFMQDMMMHHAQAVEMSALVPSRSSFAPVQQASQRISASQGDEIHFMQNWLRERGQTVPDVSSHSMAGMDHGAHQMPAGMTMNHDGMPGMATPQQMAELGASRGAAFDRLFLERMIHHHEGALTMARALLRRPGAAYDPVLFTFVNDVINEQQAEIERMHALLGPLAGDRRATLSPGFRDAGQAMSNMSLLVTLPKPTGFFDPNNPANLPPRAPARAAGAPAPTGGFAGGGNRAPLLSFANTDMAFAGDLMAVGNYHGFNLYRIARDARPQLVSSVICPGGQGDMSIVGNLLIMSVEEQRGRTDCGREGVPTDVSAERFRGIRIFDIADPTRVRQVGQVQTCRGSHTHSVVSSQGDSIIVYASGTSSIRRNEELSTCIDTPGDTRNALFRIDVVEIPKADPSRARIIDSPTVFADANGNAAGLWHGGSHGEGTQETARTDQCHDITVFPSRHLAAGACSGNGIIFDIEDPRRPRRIDVVSDPNFSYWHSATFNNDGTKVLFTDEWGGGGRPRCRVQDPRDWGADAIYDIVDGHLRFRSHYKLPAAQTEEENCVAHNGSIVPVPGRDIFVQAWYQGGISVLDFTDSANPREIAYFDRGPIDGEHMVLGGYWSAYWYRGNIYGTEIARGLDVLSLQPSADLTANELAAASLANQGQVFNPQQQFPVTWPDEPVVALAYLDQLGRSRALGSGADAALRQALGQAGAKLNARQTDRALGERLVSLGRSLSVSGNDPASARRTEALRSTLQGIAARLR